MAASRAMLDSSVSDIIAEDCNSLSVAVVLSLPADWPLGWPNNERSSVGIEVAFATVGSCEDGVHFPMANAPMVARHQAI